MVQSVQLEEEGSQNAKVFIIQKIADYENFCESDQENEDDLISGTNGHFLLKFFQIEDENTLRLKKKVLVNSNINNYFSPNVISVTQVGNNIYFYQIINRDYSKEKSDQASCNGYRYH